MKPDISIQDYKYCLPDERIAKYPLENRDSSKLLRYDSDRNISDYVFSDLPGLVPSGALMFFNDTKVVPARLFFRRESGAHIEVFCLEPVFPAEYNLIFSATQCCRWKCIVGNVKRWKGDILSCYDPDGRLSGIALTARLAERQGEVCTVEFRWEGGKPFSEVLDACGKVPIPPYLNRETEDIDLERYQTTYARFNGSVAAPTAGLHFTPEVMTALEEKGVELHRLCLHVGAGTFLPVKTDKVSEHPMHREPFVISRRELEALLQHKKVVAVGTTSVRTLESLYYIGVSILEKGEPEDVPQWAPYVRDYEADTEEALRAILGYLDANGLSELKAGTRIIIVPGFKFRIVDMMVTNFHQPQSTLLLLISAFVGGDWRRIYDHALAGGYRFLSYGDSSLLTRSLSDPE
ncbi:MAG: S-adenosylmethionine:tRNA ribosyltransferase-isomerase [Bacteroidales bacterium]|nr:S-adenosylmethionine:tRNA ribosyltransferase-isomerase [Bacteroidales bacterium]